MRRLKAIMYMAIPGSSHQEEKSLAKQVRTILNLHGGELVKQSDTEFFLSFDDPTSAVNCALIIREKIAEFINSSTGLGIHIGDLEIENQNIFGSGVEGARFICQQVSAGKIGISRRVFDSPRFQQELKDRPELQVERMEKAWSGQKNSLNPVYSVRSFNNISSDKTDLVSQRTVTSKFSTIFLGTLLVLISVFGVWWLLQTNQKTSTNPVPSVAVLPFEDFSPKGNQQWFSNGLTEEILNSLVRLEGLFVPARTSSFAFQNKNIPVDQIADSLNVNHIVEGSVRRSNGRMRIAVQLIQANSGGHLWSKTYERSTDSIFAVQKDIAKNIATTLDVYLDEERRNNMVAFGTRNVKAYEAFLKGEQILNQVRKNKDLRSHREPEKNPYLPLWEANEWYNKAISLDSTFALPYHQRTNAYFHVYRGGLSSPEDTLSSEHAYKLIQAGFNNSIRYSNNPGNRLIYRFNKAYFSKDWSSIPALAKKINETPEAYRSFVLTGGGSAPEGLIGTGFAALANRLYSEKLKQDPLNDLYKFYDVEALISLGKAELALDKYKGYLKTTPILKAGVLIHAGQLQKARQLLVNINREESSYGSVLYKTLLGIEELSRTELESYEEKYANTLVMKFYAAAGYQDKVDSLAYRVDQSPLFTCDILAPSYGNIISFNLDMTPNFAKCLDQANLKTKPYNFGGIKVRRLVQNNL